MGGKRRNAMTQRLLISAFASLTVIAILWHAPQTKAGQVRPPSANTQAGGKSSISRTPDGQPDLQGIWSFATITPLERPPELAGKEFFGSEKEAADYEAEIRKRNNMDRRDGP